MRPLGLVLAALALTFGGCSDPSTSGPDANGPDAAIDAALPDGARLDGGTCPDADGDGHASMACGGDDCDDTNAMRAPGHDEVCDAANLDEDCDPTTFGSRDQDGDGHVANTCCNGTLCGDDCNDNRSVVYPGDSEVCDGFDNDCDSAIDEGVQTTFFHDLDGDGFGDTSMTMQLCTGMLGWVLLGGDCDDHRIGVHPGVIDGPTSNCDGLDNDCDGTPDAGCPCIDAHTQACGSSSTAPCHMGTQTCAGAAWGACIGSVDPMPETCNHIDDDCDGAIDDGATVPCYVDGDHDGFAPMGATVMSVCADSVGHCPAGYTASAPTMAATTDCNDGQSSIHPGAVEACNMIDDNCNGVVDDMAGTMQWRDADGDGHGTTGAGIIACVLMTGYATNHDDCSDNDAAIHPGAMQSCRGAIDDDCNGQVPDPIYSQLGSAWCRALPHTFASPSPAAICDGSYGGCRTNSGEFGCADGWLDCDSTGTSSVVNTANGCETDGTTDTNCGHCGTRCTGGSHCRLHGNGGPGWGCG